MKQITKAQAKALYGSGWWHDLPPRDVVGFQLFQDRLAMDFGDFHAAVEKALGRSVWTHEFAFVDGLRKEFLGERQPPTFEEIIGLLPPEKVILVSPGADPTGDGGGS